MSVPKAKLPKMGGPHPGGVESLAVQSVSPGPNKIVPSAKWENTSVLGEHAEVVVSAPDQKVNSFRNLASS
jgi:hypothetical protein